MALGEDDLQWVIGRWTGKADKRVVVWRGYAQTKSGLIQCLMRENCILDRGARDYIKGLPERHGGNPSLEGLDHA